MRGDRLATLAWLRGLWERHARGEFGAAQRDERRAADELARRRAARPVPPGPSEVVNPAQLHALRLLRLGQHEQEAAAAEALEAARTARERAEQRWREADSDAEAAERLTKQRREAAALLARRAAARSLDELVATRWKERR